MKIGVLCYPTYGGSGVVATELGKAMAQRGHEIHYINHQLPVRLQDNGYVSNIFFHEVVVPNYPLFTHPPWTLALAGRVVQIIKEYKLDIIHAHYAVPHSLVAVLARDIAGRAKVISTLHGTDITLVGSEPDLYDVTRYAIEASDAVTAVSNSLAVDTATRLDIQRKIHTVYNFVDINHYKRREKSPRHLYASEDQAVIIHMSNFRPVKRLRDVVEIFARVRANRPAVLLLVGDGPERCSVMNRARELGIEEDVKFLGQQQQIVPLLSAADVMLLPSEKESFGLVALEAMACGVPVVGSLVGGLPEVVAQGAGFLAQLGDIEAMAQGTLILLDELDERRQLALARAQFFAQDHWVNEYEKLYWQVVNQ